MIALISFKMPWLWPYPIAFAVFCSSSGNTLSGGWSKTQQWKSRCIKILQSLFMQIIQLPWYNVTSGSSLASKWLWKVKVLSWFTSSSQPWQNGKRHESVLPKLHQEVVRMIGLVCLMYMEVFWSKPKEMCLLV